MVSSNSMRLFIAIIFAPQTVDYFCELQDKIEKNSKARRTSRNNLHLTLAFLGEVEYEKAVELGRRFKEIPLNIHELIVEKIMTFNNGAIVINFKECLELTIYRKKIVFLLDEMNIQYDKKRFLPHLTLFRKSMSDVAFELSPISANILSAHLFASTLTSSGPIYDIIG